MLFDEVLAAGPVRDLVSDQAWLQAMLDAEAALSAAQADAGVVERPVADEIASACVASRYDLGALARSAASSGNPAAPLARALTGQVSEHAARFVHLGATSQDIVDTAAMLVSRRAVSAILVDVWSCCDDLGALCAEHRSTVQVGRTLMQQALPTTFGLTVAGWLSGLGSAGRALAGVRPAAQLGGAVGTLASLGSSGPAVLAAYAKRLGLAEPDAPWHTDRGRIADLACGLARVSAAVSKAAGDVVLLAQTEVGEVSESAEGAGGSSTMPHKRNPVAAVSARAAAAQSPGLVATLLSSADHEHQRAAGAWHAEWRPLTELLRSTGSAVWWLRQSVSRLTVHPDRMRENLARTGGALLAERVTTELAPSVGRLRAHDAVAECVRAGGDLATRLAEHPALDLTRERAEALLDPAGYLGAADEFVTRALRAHARRRDGH